MLAGAALSLYRVPIASTTYRDSGSHNIASLVARKSLDCYWDGASVNYSKLVRRLIRVIRTVHPKLRGEWHASA